MLLWSCIAAAFAAAASVGWWERRQEAIAAASANTEDRFDPRFDEPWERPGFWDQNPDAYEWWKGDDEDEAFPTEIEDLI